MVRAIATSSASASAAPTAVQGAFATDPAASGESRASLPSANQAAAQIDTGTRQQIFRYNSFEFVYRQDVGRIVLIGQSPETGETVIQVPSERALRVYAQTARSARLEQAQLPQSEPAVPAPAPAPAPSLPLQQALTALVGSGSSSAGLSVSA
jgi:hypothetical protein